MPLIKLKRINKGGEIVLGSAHIVFIETESRSPTALLTDNTLLSAEETPVAIAESVEQAATTRINHAIGGFHNCEIAHRGHELGSAGTLAGVFLIQQRRNSPARVPALPSEVQRVRLWPAAGLRRLGSA